MARQGFVFKNAQWLGAGALMMFLSSFGQTFFISVFAGHLQQTFDLSHGAWGTLYAVGTTASAIVMVWAGVLADRMRARTLGTYCLLGLSLACFFMAINPLAALLPVAIFLLRFAGQGMASHIAIVSMARWFVATRGKALAVSSLGYSLGEILLPVSFVFLLAFIDWRLLWVAAGIIAIASILPLRRLLKTERVPTGKDTSDVQAGMDARHWTRLEALRHPLFWLLVPAVVGLPAFGTAYLFHQVHFSEIKGVSHLTFVAMLPIYSVTAIGAMILSGIALDRVGTPRLIPYYMLPAAIAFALSAVAQGPFSLALALVFFGMTTGSQGTLTNAFWAEVYGTAHIGAIKAMAAAAMVFGSAIGPALTGMLIDWGVGLEAQYIGIAAYLVLASIAVAIGVLRIRPRLSAAS